MWFEMRPEDLAFLDGAPVVHVAEADLVAAPAEVFGAFAEATAWKHWFPRVREASYTSPPPYGVGTIRQADVAGTRWIEEVIAWDAGRRLAWTVTRASVPLASAQVEAFDLSEMAGGTHVRWTLALEPRWLARLGAPFAGRTVSRLLHRAMDRLDTYLDHRPASTPARASR